MYKSFSSFLLSNVLRNGIAQLDGNFRFNVWRNFKTAFKAAILFYILQAICEGSDFSISLLTFVILIIAILVGMSGILLRL